MHTILSVHIHIYKTKQTSKSAESKHKKKIRLQFWPDLPMTLKIYQDHQQNIKGRVSSWIFFTTYQQHGVISAWITHSQLLYTGSIHKSPKHRYDHQHESHIHSYSIPAQYASHWNTGMTISMNHTFTLTLYQVNTQVRETQVWPSA